MKRQQFRKGLAWGILIVLLISIAAACFAQGAGQTPQIDPQAMQMTTPPRDAPPSADEGGRNTGKIVMIVLVVIAVVAVVGVVILKRKGG